MEICFLSEDEERRGHFVGWRRTANRSEADETSAKPYRIMAKPREAVHTSR
jgi:hypothetical protein